MTADPQSHTLTFPVSTDAVGANRSLLQSERVTVIEQGALEREYWRDLWRFRELFAILTWRDLTLRHRQTVLGVAWSVIRPLTTVLVLSFVFGRVAKLPSDGSAPYPLMVLAGLLPWSLISSIVGQVCSTVLNNAPLMSKIYFPRLLLPAVTVATALMDALISVLLLFAMFLWFGFVPSWRILFLPVFLVFAVLASIGPGLWFTAMNVRYRDFQYGIGYFLQFGLYISPVGFSSAAVPQQWRFLYSLNPAVGVIDGFRWCLFRGAPPLYMPGLVCSVLITTVMLWAGVTHFRKSERTFVDLV